jgi:hypothetical protein
MRKILQERGLWPSDRRRFLAQCNSNFKCDAGPTDCCARRTLFCQPDFVQQKSALSELVKRRGHLCDFYPKYHCELNFIEQYWGAAKLRYRNTPSTRSIAEMCINVKLCLDAVPLESICQSAHSPFLLTTSDFFCSYANRSARFIDSYHQGLSGSEAAWANRRYHGHRTLPPKWARKVWEDFTSQFVVLA